MSGYIVRGEEKSVVLSARQVDALVSSGSGEAALLFLLLQRLDRGVTPEELQRRLGWSALQLSDAEGRLEHAGLLQRSDAHRPPRQADELPQYTGEQLLGFLENKQFAMLLNQTEERLGKKLNSEDVKRLCALCDHLGLPEDVVYLLVCHCIERTERRFGEGRRPTMRQIEKEAYRWESLGIRDQAGADRYLKDYRLKDERTYSYARVLQIHDRPLVEAERRTVFGWIEKGFPPETVALAYERTVERKGNLDWRYLNGILRRWAEAGIRTPQQVEQERANRPAAKTAAAPSAARPAARAAAKGLATEQDTAWMKKYIPKKN